MSYCPSSAWDSFNSANESMSDKDIALAERIFCKSFDLQDLWSSGTISGYDVYLRFGELLAEIAAEITAENEGHALE